MVSEGRSQCRKMWKTNALKMPSFQIHPVESMMHLFIDFVRVLSENLGYVLG